MKTGVDVKKEIDYRINDMTDRYRDQYGVKKNQQIERKVSLRAFVPRWGGCSSEVTGMAVQEWYDNLTDVRELAVNTAERHFYVMHHMMRKAATI